MLLVGPGGMLPSGGGGMGQVTQSMAGMNFVAQPQAPNMMTGSMFLYK